MYFFEEQVILCNNQRLCLGGVHPNRVLQCHYHLESSWCKVLSRWAFQHVLDATQWSNRLGPSSFPGRLRDVPRTSDADIDRDGMTIVGRFEQ